MSRDRASLGLELLDGDPLAHRIAAGERAMLVAAALSEGDRKADAMLERFSLIEPRALAAVLGVAVVTSEGEPFIGDRLRLASYRRHPPRITLFTRGLRHLASRLEQAGHEVPDLDSVYVAHELFHHLDEGEAGRRLARRFAVPVLRLGPWAWRVGLISLPEIAAGAFAQRLLDLPDHPRAFERPLPAAEEDETLPADLVRAV